MTLFALPAARPAPDARRTARPFFRTRLARPWIALPCLVAAVGAGAFAVPAAAAGADPQLATLIRFMALVKGAMVLAALGLACWRLRAPASPLAVAAYAAALAAMAAAPGLIAGLAHVAAGAALFHAGLLGFAVTALRDDAVLPRWRRPRRR